MRTLNTNLLHRPLPECPAPRCRACRQPLFDVRAYRADQPHARLVLVQCLSRCEKCSTPHIGSRALAPSGRGLRLISQRFDRFSAERQADLMQVSEFLKLGEQPVDCHADLAFPSHPVFAIWFENTLVDPERVAPQTAAAGLPVTALVLGDGVDVLERRSALAEGYLSGVLIRFSGPHLAEPWLDATRTRARCHGTLLWCRRYDIPEYALAWDSGTPAPGNAYAPPTITQTTQERDHGPDRQ